MQYPPKDYPLRPNIDDLVKNQKIPLLSFSDESESSTGKNRNPVISMASELRRGRHPGLRSGTK